mgnify:CR=1 FL=1
MEFFLKSIGVTDDVIEHLDKAQLAFQRPVVLWVGLLLLIPVGMFIYTRQRDNLSTLSKKDSRYVDGDACRRACDSDRDPCRTVS